ncbi:F0F1 ATP synthase subunit A [Nigerium massiliense]|uniref:F0F1 ATP synthase subunit A n=1 Tax=Nigerium massiliense TaxID=1522317 RepID=UPI000A68B19D
MSSLLVPMEGEGDHSGWPPSAESFNSRPLFPELGPNFAWLNNHMAQAVIGALIVIGVWLWLARRHSVVPGKRQFFGEQAYNLVRNSVARDALGPDFRKYLPYLLALFSFILVNNLFGELFVFMFPTFSKIGYAYGLALCTFILYNAVGIKKWGFAHYMRKMTLPEGVPWPLWFLIIPLEFLSNFIVRPFTLALRLFANLFAGHLVVLVFVLGSTLLMSMSEPIGQFSVGLMKTAGAVGIVFSFAIFALELLIAFIQAYIFTVLTAQYVASSLAEDH